MKAVVFDFDGTLVDTFELINTCLYETIVHFSDETDIKKAEMLVRYGPTEEGILQKAIPTKHREAYIYVLNLYNSYHDKFLNSELNKAFIEIFSLIHHRGLKVFLLTGRGNETLAITLSKLNAFSYFDDFYTGSTKGVVKTELLEKLMNDYGIKNDELFYIGDSLKDTISCKEANVHCVTVTYFNEQCLHQSEEVKKNLDIVTDIPMLKTKILSLIENS